METDDATKEAATPAEGVTESPEMGPKEENKTTEDMSFADDLEESEPPAVSTGDTTSAPPAFIDPDKSQTETENADPAAEKSQPASEKQDAAGDVEMQKDKSDHAPKIPADAEPISEFSSTVENGDATAGASAAHAEGQRTEQEDADAKEAGPEPEAEPPLTELEKLWKPVNENPGDFTAWTLLIQYAESQCFMEEIRDVLDKFLARYPYCYGYWKKYADLEKKRGTAEQCTQVFERALEAVPLSVDLWLHYLAHVRAENEQQPTVVRAAFERAVEICGLEFRSDRLWEQYASWETLNKEPPRALAVYKRAIAVPTLSYRTHFENLEQFVGETPPQELLTPAEFLEARRAVLAELRESQPAPEPPPADLLPPGCDEPPPGIPSTPLLSADEEGVRMRARILAPLRQVHKDNEKQVSLRWTHEELIKRPYFHVKPLERGQLKNWKMYLDFEIEQGDPWRVTVLFERCLIACALYEEFWVKYIRYLESVETPDTEKIRAVYQRACWTHLPDKAAIHMLWATFEERMGDYERATDIVERLCARVSLLEVQLRRINLARRRGHMERVETLYAEALKNATHRPEAVLVAVKFVRFLYKIRGDRPKAEEVLREAIRQDPTNVRLYQQLVDLGFQATPVDTQLCQEAFAMAQDSPMELRDRALMAHRRCEFLEEFSCDINSLQTAQEAYFTLARALKAEGKKRPVESGDAGDAAAGDAKSPGAGGVKRSASDTGSTNGVMMLRRLLEAKKHLLDPGGKVAESSQDTHGVDESATEVHAAMESEPSQIPYSEGESITEVNTATESTPAKQHRVSAPSEDPDMYEIYDVDFYDDSEKPVEASAQLEPNPVTTNDEPTLESDNTSSVTGQLPKQSWKREWSGNAKSARQSSEIMYSSEVSGVDELSAADAAVIDIVIEDILQSFAEGNITEEELKQLVSAKAVLMAQHRRVAELAEFVSSLLGKPLLQGKPENSTSDSPSEKPANSENQPANSHSDARKPQSNKAIQNPLKTEDDLVSDSPSKDIANSESQSTEYHTDILVLQSTHEMSPAPLKSKEVPASGTDTPISQPAEGADKPTLKNLQEKPISETRSKPQLDDLGSALPHDRSHIMRRRDGPQGRRPALIGEEPFLRQCHPPFFNEMPFGRPRRPPFSGRGAFHGPTPVRFDRPFGPRGSYDGPRYNERMDGPFCPPHSDRPLYDGPRYKERMDEPFCQPHGERPPYDGPRFNERMHGPFCQSDVETPMGSRHDRPYDTLRHCDDPIMRPGFNGGSTRHPLPIGDGKDDKTSVKPSVVDVSTQAGGGLQMGFAPIGSGRIITAQGGKQTVTAGPVDILAGLKHYIGSVFTPPGSFQVPGQYTEKPACWNVPQFLLDTQPSCMPRAKPDPMKPKTKRRRQRRFEELLETLSPSPCWAVPEYVIQRQAWVRARPQESTEASSELHQYPRQRGPPSSYPDTFPVSSWRRNLSKQPETVDLLLDNDLLKSVKNGEVSERQLCHLILQTAEQLIKQQLAAHVARWVDAVLKITGDLQTTDKAQDGIKEQQPKYIVEFINKVLGLEINKSETSKPHKQHGSAPSVPQQTAAVCRFPSGMRTIPHPTLGFVLVPKTPRRKAKKLKQPDSDLSPAEGAAALESVSYISYKDPACKPPSRALDYHSSTLTTDNGNWSEAGRLHIVIGDSVAEAAPLAVAEPDQLCVLDGARSWRRLAAVVHRVVAKWRRTAADKQLQVGVAVVWMTGSDVYPDAVDKPGQVIEAAPERGLLPDNRPEWESLRQHISDGLNFLHQACQSVLVLGPIPRPVAHYDLGRKWEKTPAFHLERLLLKVAAPLERVSVVLHGRLLAHAQKRRYVVDQLSLLRYYTSDGMALSEAGYHRVMLSVPAWLAQEQDQEENEPDPEISGSASTKDAVENETEAGKEEISETPPGCTMVSADSLASEKPRIDTDTPSDRGGAKRPKRKTKPPAEKDMKTALPESSPAKRGTKRRKLAQPDASTSVTDKSSETTGLADAEGECFLLATGTDSSEKSPEDGNEGVEKSGLRRTSRRVASGIVSPKKRKSSSASASKKTRRT